MLTVKARIFKVSTWLKILKPLSSLMLNSWFDLVAFFQPVVFGFCDCVKFSFAPSNNQGTALMEEFSFSKWTALVKGVVTTDLSSFYFDAVKDRWVACVQWCSHLPLIGTRLTRNYNFGLHVQKPLVHKQNEALTRHVVKAQLTRHTHTHSRMHTGKRQQTRHTHTQLPAGAIVANLASSAHALYALCILCSHANRRLPFQAFTFG